MGGVGKTALVLNYAASEDCQTLFPGGIFYIDARSSQDLMAQFVALTAWQFKGEIDDRLSAQQKLTICWQAWQRRQERSLLIVDDLSGLAERLDDCLPPVELVSLQWLMTSRESPEAEGVAELSLAVLSVEAARAFLASIIGEGRVAKEPEAAAALCEELGRLPLAVELVGYYLRKSDYLKLSLQGMREKLVEKVKHPSLSPLKKPLAIAAKRGVQAAFDLSWEEFRPEAQFLACVLGSFAAAPIAWAFVVTMVKGLQGEAFREDDLRDHWLDSLRRLHFVRVVEADLYDLHPLIRDYLGAQLKLHPEREQIKQAFWDCCTGFASEVEISSTQKIFNLIAPHLQKRVDEDEGKNDVALGNILNGLAILYESQGKYSKAEPLLLQSLSIVESHLRADHPNVATNLNNLAELYQSQGRYSEAEPLYLRSQSIIESQLGADHFLFATSLNNLANLYRSQGRYSEAEPLYLRSLSIMESQLGVDHLHVAASLQGLALLYKSQGRYSEAEPLYLRSLSITKSQLGADHPNVAKSLNNLAELYKSQGRYSEAEPILLQSLFIADSQLGADHSFVAASLNNLALLYQLQGRYSEAEPLYLRSQSIDESQLGADHPDVASSFNNLALLYKSQGRYSEAEPLFLRSQFIAESQLGADHPNVANSLSNLATLYYSQGRYSEAEPLLLRSLSIRESQLGADHPQVATSLNNLAGLYESQGRYSESDPLYQKALHIAEQSLGIAHPNTMTYRANYARCLKEWSSRPPSQPQPASHKPSRY